MHVRGAQTLEAGMMRVAFLPPPPDPDDAYLRAARALDRLSRKPLHKRAPLEAEDRKGQSAQHVRLLIRLLPRLSWSCKTSREDWKGSGALVPMRGWCGW